VNAVVNSVGKKGYEYQMGRGGMCPKGQCTHGCIAGNTSWSSPFTAKPLLIPVTIQQVRKLRKAGKTVPEIMHQMALSKASVYRALGADKAARAN
jgi:hypothetical protein